MRCQPHTRILSTCINSWTISKRIVANAALFALVTLVIAGIGVISLRTNAHYADARLVNDAIPGINYGADVAISAFRGHVRVLMANDAKDAAAREKYLAQMREATAAAGEALKGYESSITAAEDRRNFEQLKQLREQYVAQRELFIAAFTKDNGDEALRLLNEKVEPAFAAYRDQFTKILHWNQDVAKTVSATIAADSRRAYVQTLVISVAGLAIALVITGFIVRGINRTLQGVAGSLGEASDQVASAAGQVSSSAQSLASGASQQAASLEETTSSLEEMSSMTKRNAEGATTAKTLSSETRAAAESGNSSVDEMRRAMDAIKASSSDIAKIIKTIDEIAFQTNILALNAAVEAARAGEAGAGFAVVAEEVRALAQRSANSAKETAEKIEIAIRNGEEGAKISETVAQALAVIVEKARNVDSLVAEIATASLEQNQGIDQITKAATQMDQITQSNAGSAEESAAAAEELNAQAVSMNESVQQLRRLVGGVAAAPAPHRAPPPPAKSAAPSKSHVTPQRVVKPALQSRAATTTVGATAHESHFIDS